METKTWIDGGYRYFWMRKDNGGYTSCPTTIINYRSPGLWGLGIKRMKAFLYVIAGILVVAAYVIIFLVFLVGMFALAQYIWEALWQFYA